LKGVQKVFGYKELFFGAAAIVAVDQITKIIVRDKIPLYSSVQVIGGFFNLTHLQNRGAAFNFLSKAETPWIGWGFTALAFVAIALITYVYASLKEDDHHLKIGLILILGGAAGNLTDRLTIGSVTDFIDMYVSAHHWPAYNVADSCISIGAVLVGIDWFFKIPTAKTID
jgi:signal peptidase II